MEIYFEAGFETVYLVNGTFREKSGAISYPSGSPLYITVLPLNAVYLPYTLRIIGEKLYGNENLADYWRVGEDKFLLKLKERHNYVYSPVSNIHSPGEQGTAFEFFRHIKKGDIPSARKLLTQSLNESIDDAGLAGFFAAYSDISANRFADISANYLLVGENNKCEAFNFAFSGNLIDNIEQI